MWAPEVEGEQQSCPTLRNQSREGTGLPSAPPQDFIQAGTFLMAQHGQRAALQPWAVQEEPSCPSLGSNINNLARFSDLSAAAHWWRGCSLLFYSCCASGAFNKTHLLRALWHGLTLRQTQLAAAVCFFIIGLLRSGFLINFQECVTGLMEQWDRKSVV